MTKNALIVGANSDIAQAIAELLAKQGYDLTLASRNESNLKALCSDLSIRYDIKVTCRKFDALHIETHNEFYKSLKQKPDLFICAFGYLGDQEKAKFEWEEAEKIMMTNYVSAVSITNIIAQDFRKRKEGCVVGISSIAGIRGRQSNYFYGSAKAAYTTYLSGLRNELFSYGVTVLTVLPGFVKTKMLNKKTPGKLTASPLQVAEIIYAGIKKKKNVIYVYGRWRFIMLIIRNIPESIFKRLKL